MRLIPFSFLLAATLLLMGCAGPGSYHVSPDAYNYAMAIHDALPVDLAFPNPHPDAQWFPNAKLGLFMHWGIHSVKALQPSWAMIKDYPYAHLPAEEDPNKYIGMNYYHLAEAFDPQSYDPHKWLRAAAQAGFKYAVLTTKHHDGYALWPSKYGDMSTRVFMNSRDLVKEYVQACRANNMKVGFYFSPRDWHFPEFPMADKGFDNNRRGEPYEVSDTQAQAMWRQFYAYTISQLRELLTDYGRIDVLWFDGLGGWRELGIEDTKVKQTYAWIRSLQPGIVINDRWSHRIGDFSTEEVRLPEDSKELPGWWEYCFSMKGHWGFSPDSAMISCQAFCERYNRIHKRGGCVLANIGPGPDGCMPDEFYDLCRQLMHDQCCPGLHQ